MNPIDLIDSSATYLVTGGAGFIGSHLVENLLAGGASVRVLDDLSTGREENLELFGDRIEVHRASVTDLDACQKACEGVKAVFHEAALASVPRSVKDPIATHDADATGTLNMLVAARDAGVERFVYAGSSSAYGNTPTLPKVETMSTQPLSPYAVAKLCGEQYCGAFSASYGLHTVTLRYFNIFGPRQDPTSMYAGVIPIFATMALKGEAATIDGDGEQTRDFTHVSNAVEANLRAAHVGGDESSGRTYNVGCGDRISINRLWEATRDAAGRPDLVAIHGPTRTGDVRDSLADLTAIRADLGYEGHMTLEKGLEPTLEWYRSVV